MAYLHINHRLVTPETAALLADLCPFSAIQYNDEVAMLDVNAGCKMCGICVKKGPAGIMSIIEDALPANAAHKAHWTGITVYAEHSDGKLHAVTLELLGKARELAKVTNHPVYALIIGHHVQEPAQKLLQYGADKVFIYDNPALRHFQMLPYTNLFADFIEKIKPSAVLVGATNTGRSLAPRVAARFRTGLTADCTVLQMKENTDLVQIRPAFGGNIMAQIVTKYHRPQFCTVRYKVFSAPDPVENPQGVMAPMTVDENLLINPAIIRSVDKKPSQIDISEADMIIAVGRGAASPQAMESAKALADILGGQLACTRPLIENGLFDPRRQIGLSGRTVNAKLIITLGISGSVQFAAGMKGSSLIIAVNKDETAPIFDIAHYGFVGDVNEILPLLLEKCREVTHSHAL